MDDMDLSDDLEEILLLLDDNVFLRWRTDSNIFNRSIYDRLVEQGNLRFREFRRSMRLPEIKGPPNTTKLKKSTFFQRVQRASSSSINRRRHHSSLMDMLHQRERGSWWTPQRRFVNNMFIPNSVGQTLETDNQLKYCTLYSPDGSHLLVVGMDGNVRVFNTEQRYTEVCKHFVDQTMHSILDLDISPNGREFLCSIWSNQIITCNIFEDEDINRNFIKCHEVGNAYSRMGIFSTCFSNDATELLAASNDGCIYVYDRNRETRSLRIVQDYRQDINAARFLDKTSNNVIIGGSNGGIIEIWDRRTIAQKNPKSVATLIGHHDGITYIDPKGDGRHFITNSKDQSIKLWDIRKVSTKTQVKKTKRILSNPTWNYLNDSIPPEYYGDKKPLDGDCSVMTYRGHRVRKTLIRAKFSPLETTGQRFIYTGCSTGRVIIYDTLTGRMEGNVDGHTELVRDVSWHPSRPEIASASFDYRLNLNVYSEKIETQTAAQPLRRSSRLAAKRARVSDPDE